VPIPLQPKIRGSTKGVARIRGAIGELELTGLDIDDFSAGGLTQKTLQDYHQGASATLRRGGGTAATAMGATAKEGSFNGAKVESLRATTMGISGKKDATTTMRWSAVAATQPLVPNEDEVEDGVQPVEGQGHKDSKGRQKQRAIIIENHKETVALTLLAETMDTSLTTTGSNPSILTTKEGKGGGTKPPSI
jgi:hypothetical protein